MAYDFAKPPQSCSIYRFGKNKKSHLFFHQGSECYAVALFQSEEWQAYFQKHISFRFHEHPEEQPNDHK